MVTGKRWAGGCLCGSCRYEFEGEPPHSGYCHCNMCKRSTGGGFAVLRHLARRLPGSTERQPSFVPLQ